jgi:tRNA pseudouridine65 synthase
VRIDLPVLARGPTWAVVHKPSGLPVHRSALVRSGPTLVGVAGRVLGTRVDPVHRLDQPTSGPVLFSLDRSATPMLQDALTAGHKRYLALVRGAIPTRDAYIEARSLSVDGVDKESETTLTPLASCGDPRCSLVLAEPHTGRFHQIRRHLRGLSHPVLGDSTHGDTRVNKTWRALGLHRLALHCFELSFVVDGEAVTVQAPLPADLAFLVGLPLWGEALANLPQLGGLVPAEEATA